MALQNELESAFECLKEAIELEERDDKVEAATKYYQATYIMKRYTNSLQPAQSQEKKLVEQKIVHYKRIASNLLNTSNEDAIKEARQSFRRRRDTQASQPSSSPASLSPSSHSPASATACSCSSSSSSPCASVSSSSAPLSPSSIFSRLTEVSRGANKHLSEAIEYHEMGKRGMAIEEYMAASELYLEGLRLIRDCPQNQEFDSIKESLTRRASLALDRVENLKVGKLVD